MIITFLFLICNKKEDKKFIKYKAMEDSFYKLYDFVNKIPLSTDALLC